MVFEQLTGNLIQGLVLGAVYGMATMGLSLIFGVLKVVNVGHGAFIMVGAFITLFLFNTLGINPILAVPVAFTEETWNLGAQLPLGNVLALSALSVLFIALFVYFNFYRFAFRGHVVEYCKRVLAVYLFSLLVVGIILTIVQKCPWGTDGLLALKRVLIVAFPASMSAAVSDTLK